MRQTTRRSLLVLALGLAVAGIASAGAPAILSEGGATTYWRPAAAFPDPGVPAGVPDANEDVCVSVGYQIQADGSTSEYSLLNSWTSKHSRGLPSKDAYALYAQMAVATLMQRKFVPAEAGATKPPAVYTAATFAYSGRADADRAAIRARCAIADLPEFIAKAQREATRKGIKRGEMERNRVQNPPSMSGPKGSTVNP
jgi:hypothetical protein